MFERGIFPVIYCVLAVLLFVTQLKVIDAFRGVESKLEQQQEFIENLSSTSDAVPATIQASASTFDEQRLIALIRQTIAENLNQPSYQATTTQPEVAKTLEHYQESMDVIKSITSKGLLQQEDIQNIHSELADMSKEQVEQTLSYLFQAINRGELELAPGVML
ncbi:hypothetical protein [Pleionea sp. CnH1-48]|uniref:hypothetical protein n=1 Tax=Pleionea sp. CnH1-48 TaxID=2954494 RepID=UPI002096A6F7|nr:hypothetical protein [Pleionea sp. CnH1-48]MCO7223184.1 hypothetical protein [Pleionea sp. CnH1-48]